MKYKGIEVEEANGKDYPLSPTTKKMLVWNRDGCEPYEKEVLGFYGKYWIATSDRFGVTTWKHAAEIPKQKTLFDMLSELYKVNGKYTYVVHPKDTTLMDSEERYAYNISEEDIMLWGDSLKDNKSTIIIMPECCDIVKAMSKRLAESNYEHPTIIFFGE